MRILFFGTGAFGLNALEAMKNSSHTLLSVVTAPDKPQGRRLQLQPSPVKQWAESNAVPVLQFQNPNSVDAIRALSVLNADVFVVIAFGYLLSRDLLAMPKWALNVHSSLLPKYRGAAPIHWAILNGDAETGVTVMRMADKLDAGDILLQKKTPISPNECFDALEKRLALLGSEAITEALTMLEEDRARFIPQDERKACHARKIKKEDAILDWTQPANQLHNKIRALSRWPKAQAMYQSERLLILESSVHADEMSGAKPGCVLTASMKDGLRVATGKGVLEIKTVQAEGRKAMPVAEFLKGLPIQIGSFLE
jgi:methionyl-tRNA formyltransferase